MVHNRAHAEDKLNYIMLVFRGNGKPPGNRRDHSVMRSVTTTTHIHSQNDLVCCTWKLSVTASQWAWLIRSRTVTIRASSVIPT